MIAGMDRNLIVIVIGSVGGLTLAATAVALVLAPSAALGAEHAAMLSGIGMSIVTSLLAFLRADTAATHAQAAHQEISNHVGSAQEGS